MLSEFIFTIKGLNLSVNMHFAFIRRWGLYYPWKIDKKLLKRVQVFPVAVCFLRDFSNTTVILLLPSDMKRVVQIPSTACWVSAVARSLWKGVSTESGQCLQANHRGERNSLIYSSNWLFCTQLGDLSTFFPKVCGECVYVWCYKEFWMKHNWFSFQDQITQLWKLSTLKIFVHCCTFFSPFCSVVWFLYLERGIVIALCWVLKWKKRSSCKPSDTYVSKYQGWHLFF